MVRAFASAGRAPGRSARVTILPAPVWRLRLAVVFALLLANLAGGAVARAPLVVDPALAAFFAVGGTLDDLCGIVGHHGGGAHCDACRPVGAAPLPPPASAGLARFWVEAHDPAARAEVASAWRGVFGPGLPRAPPRAT
jgi:hypothetical protein